MRTKTQQVKISGQKGTNRFIYLPKTTTCDNNSLQLLKDKILTYILNNSDNIIKKGNEEKEKTKIIEESEKNKNKSMVN